MDTYQPNTNALKVESGVHQQLKDFHVSGEWFKSDNLPEVFKSLCESADI